MSRHRRDFPIETSLPRHAWRIAPAAALALGLACSGADAAVDEIPQQPPGIRLARAGRVPLLPEGVVLTGAVGRVEFDEVDSVWVFRPRVSEQGLERALILLPGEVRVDVAEVFADAASASPPSEFEIFGRVFLHRGRNYLLASGINRVEPPTVADEPATAPAADSSAATIGDDAFLDDDSDLAARLERELEAEIGRVPRSVAVERDDAAVVPVRERRIHARRGHLRRDIRTGTLVFVPEADGTGSRDPQAELLPCRMLEQLEAFAARPSAPPIVRLSGVLIEEGPRRYLLPTAYSVPSEGRGISP